MGNEIFTASNRFIHLLTITFVVILSVALFSCQKKEKSEVTQKRSTTVDTAAIMSSIDNLRHNYKTAVNNGNVEKLKTLLTKDHMRVQAGSADWDSIRAKYKGAFPPNAKLEIVPKETKVLSNKWVYEMGIASLTFTPKGSDKPKKLTDTFLVLLKKTENGWKVHREIASSYVPKKTGM